MCVCVCDSYANDAHRCLLSSIAYSLMPYAILKDWQGAQKEIDQAPVLKECTVRVSMDARPCPHRFLFLQAFILVFLFEELCSLSLFPLPRGCFLPSFLGRCGGGRTRMGKKTSCQHSRSQFFLTAFALWHFCQHLPVLLPNFIKNNPTLENHCDPVD